MSKNLLIVESPAKAKTIEKILGNEFTVKSSFGHIRDLEKGNDAIDIKNNFNPKYVITPDKYKVVKELKEWTKKVDEVWLATDEDREGEAISWHLCHVLGLDPKTTKRIVFHEITKPAIQKAVKNPRTVDLNLVNAQQARRVLDRLVGFDLSGILWKKIKGGLSAGRVQSVAVKLVVEREREIQNFKVQSYYKIQAYFSVLNEQGKWVALKAELPMKFDKMETAKDFLDKCKGAQYKINKIEVKPAKRKPAAPFITSTLQQEASRKLGFSVNRTMQNAQRLYEEGHITYMRTDSTNLSEEAINNIANEVARQFGTKYVQSRQYKTNNANAQEAHEAIRPTYPEKSVVTTDRDMQRLYELIWKRAVASQMADAELERTIVQIGISTRPNDTLIAEGEVLKFDGFLKVYLESKDEEEEDVAGMLPPLKVGQQLDLSEMTATERFTRPPARYTEASLVKKMEELGIGRPSTYAPTVSKIMEEGRGYVVKDSKDGNIRDFRVFTLKNDEISEVKLAENTGAAKNMLFPTDMGLLVCDFLDDHFDKIMNYGFTAEIEQQFDDIASGQKDWTKMMKGFYGNFYEDVQKTIKEADRANGERILGTDPETGKTILVRMSRLGPVVQIGKAEELQPNEKPKYANLKVGQSLENINVSEALELFKLPKILGKHPDGTEISVGLGRFGPYLKYGELYVSLPKTEDPHSVTLLSAAELIEEKLDAEKPICLVENKPVTKGKGRFGPFIKWNDMYINIPKKYNFDTISEKDCRELIDSKLEKESNRYVKVWEEVKVMIENGRWGPFIRFGKQAIALPKIDGKKLTSEDAAMMKLEDVKKIILEQIPDAFEQKKKVATKKK